MIEYAALRLLDDALIRLRRLWSAGTPRWAARAERIPAVEMSTVLIADALDRLGEQPATIATIAGRLDVAPSTASRLVDRAVAAGIVRRMRSEVDPRRADLALTSAGRELVADAAHFRLGYLRDLTAGWSPRDVDRLAQLLDRFAAAVHDQPQPADEPHPAHQPAHTDRDPDPNI